MTHILLFFWPHIKPYRWLYACMMLGPLFSGFYSFLYNYSIKLIIDAISTSGSLLTYQELLFPCVIFILTHITLDVSWRISNIASWKSEPYVKRSILLSSYNTVQHHPYTFFQDNFAGAISSKLKGISQGYEKLWNEIHHGLWLKIYKAAVSISALAWINPVLGLFMFSWSAAYSAILYKLSVRMNQLSFQETETQHSITGQISDRISNMVSIFSFASKDKELASLKNQISNELIPRQIRSGKYNFKFQVTAGLLYWLLFGFLLFFMIHLRKQGLVSIGDFAFVFGISLVAAEDIWQATVSLQDFSLAMGDLKSAISIVNVGTSDTKANAGTKKLIVQNPTIEFHDVNFAYGQNEEIFRNFNLKIKAGEKIGLVGQSGAGKSSLVSLLLRYFEPVSGHIDIDGQNIAHVLPDSLREHIAVIPQDTLLFHRSILENIRFGKPGASDEEVIAASQKAHIHEFIDNLPEKYQTFVGERGIKLSGGQRQRIAIARAILKDSPILILDEATSSLDMDTEALIQESLNVLIEDKKKTVIAIAHRLSTLKHMDRVIELDRRCAGEIV